ncbi:MAG: sigma-70 family RNA polymerase sigma factor [Anaerolineae bacterium]|nr:sigma-70 family RNA polymerase sigma factor [Anaerolineae bacterium]MDW8100068.1 sigma-70 family RNA polymerase sigma factor [Anaerolineae bacterium]
MADSYPDDTVLLQRVANGDESALLLLHTRYVNLVYSMALHILRDPSLAEEVTQDVFLKLWQKSERYDPRRGRFATWLLSVTRFAAIDRLRYEGRHFAPSSELSGQEAVNSGGWRQQADWEQGQQLRMLLWELPPDQRELIELAYFGGMTHRDLAEHLRLPLGTVKSRLRLGLQRLRALWLEGASEDQKRYEP